MSESIDRFILLFAYTLCNILELQLKLFYIIFSYDILAENVYLLVTFCNTAMWANMSIVILKAQWLFNNLALLEMIQWKYERLMSHYLGALKYKIIKTNYRLKN